MGVRQEHGTGPQELEKFQGLGSDGLGVACRLRCLLPGCWAMLRGRLTTVWVLGSHLCKVGQ